MTTGPQDHGAAGALPDFPAPLGADLRFETLEFRPKPLSPPRPTPTAYCANNPLNIPYLLSLGLQHCACYDPLPPSSADCSAPRPGLLLPGRGLARSRSAFHRASRDRFHCPEIGACVGTHAPAKFPVCPLPRGPVAPWPVCPEIDQGSWFVVPWPRGPRG